MTNYLPLNVLVKDIVKLICVSVIYVSTGCLGFA